MLLPPQGSSFHSPCIDIKTTAESLVNGRMHFHHVCHQDFLLGRTHCNEHHIGSFARYILNQGITLFIIVDITVAITNDCYSIILRFQLFDRIFYYILLASYQIECLFAVASLNDI